MLEPRLHLYIRVVCFGCGRLADIPVCCGNRFCPVCSLSRLASLRTKLEGIIRVSRRPQGYELKFITLTIPNVSDLKAGVKSLISAFRRLRQRRFWINSVWGGCYVIEFTRGTGGWHAHLHILTHARFIPVRLLSRQWEKCSGGRIVWIQRIERGPGVNYVLKYVSRASVPADYVDEAGEALKGIRLFQPFGAWHGVCQSLPKVKAICPFCNGTAWGITCLPRYLTLSDKLQLTSQHVQDWIRRG